MHDQLEENYKRHVEDAKNLPDLKRKIREQGEFLKRLNKDWPENPDDNPGPIGKIGHKDSKEDVA